MAAPIKSSLPPNGPEDRLAGVRATVGWNNRALFRLLWPLVVEQLLGVTIGLVDTIMVTSIGEFAVSGVSIVDTINVLLITAFGALATGGAVVSSQYLGRRDVASANRSARQLVYIIMIVSTIFMGITLILRRSLLRLIYGNIPADVMQAAEIYFLITSLSYPGMALYNACSALFRSMGNSRITMLTALMINIFHIVGNSILIFGLHIGVAGAAVSTLISRIAGGLFLFVLLRSRRSGLISLKKMLPIRFEPALIRSILKIGVPSGLETSIFQVGKIMIARIFTGFGTAAIAANAITNVISSFGFMPGSAYGLALITIVGQCVGAGDYGEAKKHTVKLIKIGYVSYFLVNLFTVIFMEPILGIFALSGEAHELAKTFVWVNSIASVLFWAPSFILPNSLKAAGDATYCMIVAILSMWFVRVCLSYMLCYVLGFGPIGAWFGMGADFVVRSIFYTGRWLGGKWQRQTVLN